jgi:hypothetical protein
MNELQLLKVEELNISTKFAPIKKELETILKPYKEIVVTEDTLKTCKADTTKLNQLAKAITDRKIKVKKDYTVELSAFEKECVGMVKDILEVRQTILVGSETFIQKQREEKRTKVNAIIAEIIESLKLEDKYSKELGVLEAYLNASTTLKSIKEDVSNKAALLKSTQDAEIRNLEIVVSHIQTTNDLLGLETPLKETDFSRFLVDTAALDVTSAMTEINRVGKSRKEAEENARQRAIEVERKRVEQEVARAKAEEERKVKQLAEIENRRIEREREVEVIKPLPVEPQVEDTDSFVDEPTSFFESEEFGFSEEIKYIYTVEIKTSLSERTLEGILENIGLDIKIVDREVI